MFSQTKDKAFELYQKGDTKAARKQYKKELNTFKNSSNLRVKWNVLMRMAWFEHEISEHKKALEHSEQALEVAKKINDPFMIGRSLTWIAWSYSSLGNYVLASFFYEEALAIGAPGGKIKIVPVWGLAKQELGNLFFKQGKLDKALKHLLITYEFAKKKNVLVGVSEGGAHLALVYLEKGDVSLAERHAREAVKASLRCNCSANNLSRARVALAKVLWKKYGNGTRKFFTQKSIESALKTARKTKNMRYVAEALMLKSKFLDKSDAKEKRKIAKEAYEILIGSDLRGAAAANVGRMFLEDELTKKAKKYLELGLKVNKEMFRSIDNAYIESEIAEVHGLDKKQKKYFITLEKATADAKKIGQSLLVLKNSELLANDYSDAGFTKKALKWAKSGIQTLTPLIEKEKDEQLRYKLEDRRSDLESLASNLMLSLETELTF